MGIDASGECRPCIVVNYDAGPLAVEAPRAQMQPVCIKPRHPTIKPKWFLISLSVHGELAGEKMAQVSRRHGIRQHCHRVRSLPIDLLRLPLLLGWGDMSTTSIFSKVRDFNVKSSWRILNCVLNEPFIQLQSDEMNSENEHLKSEKIVLAGAKVLAHWGLHRTKIKDVAVQAKVATGTVYLYVDSKDSLFDLALRYGMGKNISELLELGVPYSTTRRQTFEWLSSIAKLDLLLPDFQEPLLLEIPLEKLIGNLFDFLSNHKFAIRIVERSAHEWEELATLFFEKIRDPVIRRIGKRIAHEDPGLSRDEYEAKSRLVGGAIAFASVHRFFEGGPPDTTAQTVYKSVVVDCLVRMIKRS